MQSERRIVAFGVVAVLLIATIGAWAARSFGFQYWILSFLSLAIYFTAGAAAVRTGAAVGRATGLGAVIGFVDVTLGWALSAAIGPGRLQDSPFDGGTAIVIGGAVALAAYVVAAWLGAVTNRRRTRAPAA
jgi:hypothetical protein